MNAALARERLNAAQDALEELCDRMGLLAIHVDGEDDDVLKTRIVDVLASVRRVQLEVDEAVGDLREGPPSAPSGMR